MTNVKLKKRIFIIWGREVKLSQYLALSLDAQPFQIYYDKFFGFDLHWSLRYLIQTFVTWAVLLRERPSVVYVQNPPTVAPLACLIYCKLFGARLMIDSHTAAFLDEKWMRLFWLFRFVARQADLNTCHNFKNLELLKAWGIDPRMVMQFFNPSFSEDELKKPLVDVKLNTMVFDAENPILMVNRFANDDDYLTVIETAKLLPQMSFFIVGNYHKVKDLPAELPSNVYLTGYLPHEEFLKLMYRAKVVLAFTTRVDTVLWSIREILALHKPFVTTDSEVMHHYFDGVALFAGSNPHQIKDQIELAIKNRVETEKKMENFLIKDRVRWQIDINNINKLLNNKV